MAKKPSRSRAEQLNREVAELLDRHVWKEAREKSLRAIESWPELARSHALAAIAAWRTGDHDAATAAFARAKELDPTESSTDYHLACFHAARGDKPAMLAALARAIAASDEYRTPPLHESDFAAFHADPDLLALCDSRADAQRLFTERLASADPAEVGAAILMVGRELPVDRIALWPAAYQDPGAYPGVDLRPHLAALGPRLPAEALRHLLALALDPRTAQSDSDYVGSALAALAAHGEAEACAFLAAAFVRRREASEDPLTPLDERVLRELRERPLSAGAPAMIEMVAVLDLDHEMVDEAVTLYLVQLRDAGEADLYARVAAAAGIQLA